MPESKPEAVGSLSRGLDILELLAEHGSLRLADLPAPLGVSRATAYRILSQLQDRGYVEHDREAHRYSLGASAVALAARSKSASLISTAEPALNRLNAETQETVNLAVLQGGRLVYVRIIEGGYALRMSGNVGEEAPLYATAMGKAILAHVSLDRRLHLVGDEPFPKFTSTTVSTYAELDAAVDRARLDGYAVDNEEVDTGAICLGAAILGEGVEPVGAVSISAPASRISTRVEEFGRLTAEAAQDISHRFELLTSQR